MDWKVQRVVANFGSSEQPGLSSSILNSYVSFYKNFAIRGTTTAEGLYANSVFVLNHDAFGSVRAASTFVLGPSTSTSGSNRRVPPPRGFLLAAHPWAFPSGSSCRSLVPLTRRHLMPRFAARGPLSAGSALPSSLGISFLSSSPIRGVFGFHGRRMSFPVCVRLLLWRSCFVRLRSWLHGTQAGRAVSAELLPLWPWVFVLGYQLWSRSLQWRPKATCPNLGHWSQGHRPEERPSNFGRVVPRTKFSGRYTQYLLTLI